MTSSHRDWKVVNSSWPLYLTGTPYYLKSTKEIEWILNKVTTVSREYEFRTNLLFKKKKSRKQLCRTQGDK